MNMLPEEVTGGGRFQRLNKGHLHQGFSVSTWRSRKEASACEEELSP